MKALAHCFFFLLKILWFLLQNDLQITHLQIEWQLRIAPRLHYT